MKGHKYMPAATSLEQPWPVWRSLNILLAGVGRSKDILRKWGFPIGDIFCKWEEQQTPSHITVYTESINKYRGRSYVGKGECD